MASSTPYGHPYTTFLLFLSVTFPLDKNSGCPSLQAPAVEPM